MTTPPLADIAPQAGNDFALAAQLLSLVEDSASFANPCELSRRISTVLANFFGGNQRDGEVHCFFGQDPPPGQPWHGLVSRALASGTLALMRDSAKHALPTHLACPVCQPLGGVLACLAISDQTHGFAAETIDHLARLADFIGRLLSSHSSQNARLQALQLTEARARQQSQMLEQIQDSIITMDQQGYITGWNRGSELLFGYRADEIIGQNILVLYADENEDDALFNAFLDHGSHGMTVRRRKKSGEVFWASVSLSVCHDEQAQPNGLIGYVVDITEKLAAEEKLRLHARIFECNSEAIVVTDAVERVVSVNHAYMQITGYQEAEILGKVPTMLQAHRSNLKEWNQVKHNIAVCGQWQGEWRDQRKNGETFPAWVSISAVHDAHGTLTNYFLVFSDITERKQAEAQIYRLAYYDSLTGLPNRALLYSLLEQSLAEAQRSKSHGALLFVDLNRFKHLNDSFGHAPADTVLAEVARRMLKLLRREDVISRIGGDEFVVALFDLNQRDHAGTVAKKILTALAAPYDIEGHEVLLSASIGISVYPDDGRDPESLIRNADVAMYRAKQQGTDGFLFYSQEMNRRSLERLKLEAGLRRALDRCEFSLVYQPQLDLASGRIVGAEALIRWEHPEQGTISPALFIPMAEETGLINPIGEWVLDEACRQLVAWKRDGINPVRLAVNLSTRQFGPKLPDLVLSILERHGVPADLLELEITESMLMNNPDAVVGMMARFSQAGISMSLDDFGTGYSSLSYLKRFPINNLKIDQSFVRGIPHDGNDSAIARAIISMAQALHLCVIAEGVETEEQLAFLREAGCDEIQGYHFSRPLSASDFAEFLERTNRPAHTACTLHR